MEEEHRSEGALRDTAPEPRYRGSNNMYRGVTISVKALTGAILAGLAAPVLAEDYADDRSGGAFLLIDPQTGRTLAAGMVRGHTVFGDRFGDAWDWQI